MSRTSYLFHPLVARPLCVNTYSLPRLRFARVKRAVRHKTTLRMHSVAFTFDDCTREMPMFTYRHANMNTKSSVKRYAQHQPHNMPTIATKPTHTSLFRGIAIRTANTATCRQSLAATAGDGCSSKPAEHWCAPRSCTSQRWKPAGTAWSASRWPDYSSPGVVDEPTRQRYAPHMHSPHSRLGRVEAGGDH